MNITNKNKLFLIAAFVVTFLLSFRLSLTQPETVAIAAHRNDFPSPTAIAQIEPKVPVIEESVEYVTID